MLVNIKSDGSNKGTFVTDENGKNIEGITAMNYKIVAPNNAQVELELFVDKVEMDCEAEFVTVIYGRKYKLVPYE